MEEFYPIDYTKPFIDFIELKVKLRPGVFIPREETEEFLREILKVNTKFKAIQKFLKGRLLLDMCTGSGVWGLTLGQRFKKTLLVDKLKKPYEITKENIKFNNISKVEVFKSNLFKNPALRLKIVQAKDWVLVCNPPYVPVVDKLMAIENRVNHEPKEALYSGNNGLYLFKRLLNELRQYNIKMPKLCIFELDPRNISKAKKMLKNLNYKVEIILDIYSRPRFLIGYLTNQAKIRLN